MMTRRRKGSGSEDNNHGMHQDQSISSSSHGTSRNLRLQEEQEEQDADFTELERREMQDNRRSSEQNNSHPDGDTTRTRNRTSLTQSSRQRQTSQESTCLSPGCNISSEVGVNFNNTSTTSSSPRIMPVSVSSSSTTGSMFTSRRTSSTQNEISSIQNNSSSLSSPTISSSRQELTSTEQLTGSDARRALNGVWSTRGASFFACFLCCVNFYTLSRFAVLAYFFKGSFMLQFLLLSLFFGVPLLLFLCSLGQYLGSGYCDIWFVTPAFRGVGYAFLLTYSIISVYWSVPVAWFFVYFRDSFLSSRETPFRWAYCSLYFNTEHCIQALNASSYEYVGWSVSSYLHSKALDRKGDHVKTSLESGIKPDLILNLGIVWCLIFLCLYQGLHRAGRLIVLSAALPLLLFTITSFRFIESYGNGIDRILTFSDKPFFLDSLSWLLAARETFLVWTVFGAASLSVSSHNKSSHKIFHQLLLMFLLVITILFLSACFFASCMEAVSRKGVVYTASSFERENETGFLRDPKLLPPGLKMSDLEVVSASNLISGESLVTSKVFDRESRFTIARFATEVFPAMLAVEGPSRVSSFWPMIFYFSVIVMNLGSLIVLLGTVLDAVMLLDSSCIKSWRPSIAFSGCALGFVFSLPLTTRFGQHIMYFIDFCFGSLWWMSLLYLLLIISILVVRGRPVGTDNLVHMLVKSKSRRLWILPLMTFHWNLVTPIVVMVLAVSFTKSHSLSGLTWTQVISFYPYWPPWVQWLSVVVQVLPLAIVFVYGLFKVTYVLTTSTQPLHERLQLLFSPILTTVELRRRGTFVQGMDPDTGVVNEGFREDPPPKYTPPPSYSAATSRAARRQLRLGSNFTIDIPNLSQFMSSSSSSDQKEEETGRKQSLSSVTTSTVKTSHFNNINK